LWGRAVTMEAASRITSSGDVTLAAAGDISVGRIEAAGRTVTVRAEGAGSTVESNAAGASNIVAGTVVLEGRGPVDGSGQALRVSSDRVDIHTPTGMAMRQTQTNGDVHFLVVVDGVHYLQLVNTQRGAVATGKTVLPSVQSTQGSVDAIVDTAGRNPVWAQGAGPGLKALAGVARSSEAPAPTGAWVLGAGQRPLAAISRLATADITWTSASSADDDIPGESLHTAFLLGQPGGQPSVAGLQAAGTLPFDYWVDNLTL